MEKISILVMSCDKNSDLWYPFHYCIEKYWSNHPNIIYSTEKTYNPYYKTICKNYPFNKWTKRVWDTVKEIDSEYILLMVDDIFIQNKVDNDLINSLTEYLHDNYASVNIESSFDKNDIPINDLLCLRNPTGKFKLSCMCQLWQKKALLDLFNCEYDPWKMEKIDNTKDYLFLISKDKYLIDFGRTKDNWKFGVIRGKWSKECKEFFDKEGINILYTKRGFFD